MCGIAGFFGMGHRWQDQSAKPNLIAMTNAIIHRGPDAGGHWVSREYAIAMGHRRLSIVDLSTAGAQPMTSHDGRYVISYNGEIYNFLELKEAVEKERSCNWRGHSDTEILLEYIACFGLSKLSHEVDGMFGFALFDKFTRQLTLMRDAFGEKPLYYGMWKGRLLFGSEIRSLEAIPGFAPKINLDALGDFFKYSYVPCPASIWEGVAKLPPGHMLTVGEKDLTKEKLPEPTPWWDMTGDAIRSCAKLFDGNLSSATDHLDILMRESVSRRMVSDVPLGAFLSGGIDSSLTVAMMQAASSKPVRTFSIGMAEEGFDESPHAAAVANYLGTDHTELVLTPTQVQDAVPRISTVHGEPFADSSQVPTFLVAEMAQEDVKVALSGDGGDEIFGGYNRYFQGPRIWRKASFFPRSVRKAMSWGLSALPEDFIEYMLQMSGGLAPRELTSGRAVEKLQKLSSVLAMPDENSFHDRLLATSDNPESLLSFDAKLSNLTMRLDERGSALTFAERAMLVDTANYMPDDVLAKVDRASMAVSLETRTPFLSRDLFRFAWTLPKDMRAGSGQGKTVLRELLYRYVPRDLVDRPKAGFAIPVGRWLRSGLRDWAEGELSAQALSRSGLLNTTTIQRIWAEHLSGKKNHEVVLWNILMFQAWYRDKRAL